MPFRQKLVLPVLAIILISFFYNTNCRANVMGYGEISVATGGQFHLRVKSIASSFSVTWYRYAAQEISADSLDSISILDSDPLSDSILDKGLIDIVQYDGYRIPLLKISENGPFPIIPQPPDDSDAYMNGCNWSVTCTIDVPVDWPSDLYLAKLIDDQGNYSFVPVIIRNSNSGTQSNIAVISSTNTWQAYNDYGGASFYTCNRISCSGFSSFVTYDRPLVNTAPAPTGHLSGIEHLLLRFLKSHGIAYEQLSDRDLHEAASTDLLSHYRILVLGGHAEYWSAEMKTAIESFLDGGGRVINLAGNTMFWKIEYNGDRMEKVIRWRNYMPGGEFSVLGAGFKGGNCCPVCAGFRALRAHWVFDNTTIGQDSMFGTFGINQGDDGCPDGSSGASGWEYDVVGVGSPSPCGPGNWSNCLELIAKGANRNYAGQPVGSDMYLYYRVRGGLIFAAPSITFTGSLAVDTSLQQIVLNVIHAFQSDSIPSAEENCCIGHRGDFNGDGTDADILDLAFAIDKIFRGSNVPFCPVESDLNGDGTSLNILDLVSLVNRCFRGGPPPGLCSSG